LIPPPGTWSDELGYDEHPFKVWFGLWSTSH
jgi:hypothetical protein